MTESEESIVRAACDLIDLLDAIKGGRVRGQGADLGRLRAAVETHRRAGVQGAEGPRGDREDN